MRVYEIITENISRRGFLRGALGAAALGAAGVAQAGAGGQHLPAEFSSQAGKAWSEMDPKTQQIWIKRQGALQKRAQAVLARLIGRMNEVDAQAVKNAKIVVPYKMALYDWARVGQDSIIELDLGTYWDLADDVIGYTIAHELGHIVHHASGLYPMNGTMNTQAQRRKRVETELAADSYGAKLAYSAGYDPKRAFDYMNQEARSWRYKPNVPGQDYYPDYQMRSQNLQKEIETAKKQGDQKAAQSAEQKLELLNKTQPQQQEDELISAKEQAFSHVFRGIQSLQTAQS